MNERRMVRDEEFVMPSLRLDGRVALITGGGRGLGSAIVKLLADAAGPCALFAIGVSLVRPDAPLKSPMLALPIAAKLLLHPLVQRLGAADEIAALILRRLTAL